MEASLAIFGFFWLDLTGSKTRGDSQSICLGRKRTVMIFYIATRPRYSYLFLQIFCFFCLPSIYLFFDYRPHKPTKNVNISL